MQLANLDNEVFFKKVFTDPEVFRAFVKDIAGVDVPDAKIETEKQLERKVAPIRFKLDIYAESADHRILIEIQRVDYDYNFDRFMHYFLAALIDLQRSSRDYGFNQEVYTIVVITAPYVVKEKTGEVLLDDVLISDINPRTLADKMRNIYPHKLIFLNPNHIQSRTADGFRDWLQFIHQSIKNPKNPLINLDKPAIRKAAQLADVSNMTDEVLEDAKKAEAGKKTIALYEDKAREEGREEGREEELESVVMKLYKKGKTPSEISGLLDISEEKVVSIVKKRD
jgi:predicted transposase/invertase (TIGR01784 family)